MFGKDKVEKRFKRKDGKGGIVFGGVEIFVDIKTGVNYLVGQEPYGGITPLLEKNGKIVIDEIE